MNYCLYKIGLLNYKRKVQLPMVLYGSSILMFSSYSYYFFLYLFLLFFPLLSFFCPPPPPVYRCLFILISTAVLLLIEFSGIFCSPLSVFSLLLSWNLTFGGVCTVHMHSMWQELGENLLINVEEEIFNLFACSGSLPRYQVPSGNQI